MKLKNLIKNKRNFIIGGVLFGTVILLTGCGQADVNIKTYEKESDDTQKISSIVNTNVDETNKVEKNTVTDSKLENDDNTKLKELLARDWLADFSSKERENRKVYFNKVTISGKDIYIVVISDDGSHNTMYLVGKKNDEYVFSKVLENEQSDIMFDASNQNMFVVESLAEFTTELYAIHEDTLTVEKFADSRINPNDGEVYWYVNNQNVSYGRYYSYFNEDNLKSTATWSLLTKENIDKVVK